MTDTIRTPAVSPADVIAVVADAFRVSPLDVVGRDREASYLVPRQVAIYLCRELTGLTLHRIGAAFNRDSSTAYDAWRRVGDLVTSRPVVAHEVGSLRAQVLRGAS